MSKFYILAMIKNLFSKQIVRNFLFWIIMFLYLLSTYWYIDHNKSYVLLYIGFKFFLQFILSLIIIKLLIPQLLLRKKVILFIICTLISIYLMQTLYSVARVYYFEIHYPEIYKMQPPYILLDRMTSLVRFLGNITWLVFPSIILMSIKYYSDQKDIIELKEQKKSTELSLLKNQLNPHFLFNTLNNLYALALKKSDKTPEVIAKLSEILDYILYQCKDNYVSIQKEIELLENYIALEKVRYGKRVKVTFEKDVQNNVNIAPLILLTFVENAFKHGVSQELTIGFIDIKISATENEIVFRLKNSKPKADNKLINSDKNSIGMENTKKQLDLLYPNKYQLGVEVTASNYSLELKLTCNEKV